MKLPRCNVCNHQFNWKKTYTALFKSRTIHCGECGTELEATNLGRLTLLVTLPMLLTGLVLNNIVFKDTSDFHFFISLLIMILIALLISLFLPYLVKYSSDK
ncbi:TIGR04104 family putative zinc finger protein [Anaerobacillus sp. MEB173]|uniref:TIGR04104 family putative zinc finger protein n=1 Tax=Anaerobacillus sp. MEB173 TaxID=3383345 RepID=UPI003F922D77